MATALAIGSADAQAAVVFTPSGNQAQNNKENPFRFMPTAGRLNTITLQNMHNLDPKAMTNLEPDITLTAPYAGDDQMQTCSIMYGPNEENWFYTMVPLYDELEGSNEYWKDISYNGVEFTLYNEKAEKIGSCVGKFPLIEGAKKCQSMQVSLSATQKFYNFDDYYEITIAANYNPLKDFGAKQVSYTFSLNNSTEPQDPICAIPGMPGYVINVGTPTAESFIMMYMDYSTWPDDDRLTRYTVYTKAGYGTNGPTKMQDFPIDELTGDNTGESPMQMTSNGNKLYIATALYEKPFFGEGEDEGSQNGNNYIITLLEQSGSTFKEVKKTVIPVPDRNEGFITSSVTLGKFRGSNDITFDFGDGKLPCYVLKFSQTDVQENEQCYYAIYDSDGKEIKRFAENSRGVMQLSNLTGHEEQYAFLMKNKDGNDVLQMIDWPSLKLGTELPVSFYDYDSGETFNLSNNLDRCLGKGGYYYIASSANGSTDDKNTIHRIAYFNGKGEVDHIDALTFKADVTKVLPCIDASIMDPYLFNSDKNFEYLAWLERKSPENANASVKVIAIVDQKGNILAEREYKLRQQYFNAYVSNPSSGLSFLCVQYTDYYGQERESRNELIRLPFNKFEGEGTIENPYLVKTYGDFNQIRNNLTSHFRIDADIDAEGRTFLQVPGTFTGSIDGGGHQVRNLVISGRNDNNAMFYQIGDDESASRSFIKDLTFVNPSMHISFQSFRIKADAMLAYQLVGTDLENVHFISPKATTDFTERNSYSNPYFGGIAARVNGCSFKGCSLLDADFDMPNSAVGGIGANFIINGSEINACAFTGKITGKCYVGGIAGHVNTTTNINDVHVNAEIIGTHSVGGVVGFSEQGPANISHAIVEGSVTGEEPFMTYAYVPEPGSDPDDPEPSLIPVETYQHYVGGIGGYMIEGSVKNSLVALGSLAWDTEKDGDYANRIVGAGAISNCHALSSLADGTDEDYNGASVEKDDLTTEWFTNLGFAFDGKNHTEPWNHDGELPTLHFEATAAQYVAFTIDELRADIEKPYEIEVVLEGFDNPAEAGFNPYFDAGEDAVEITDVTLRENGNAQLTVTFHKEGNYTLTVQCGTKSATLPVEAVDLSGIAEVTVEAAQANDPVYNLQVIKVGTRAGFDTLPAGLYIVGGQKILKK